MRKISFVLLVVVAAFFSSCDKFTNLNVPFTANFGTVDFNINSTTPNTINKVDTLDLSKIPALQQYLDQLDGMTIKAINIEIINYADSSSQTCTLNGTVKYSSINSSTEIDLATITDVKPYELYTNQTKYSCQGVVAEYQNVANLLLSDGKVKFYLNGTAIDWPAYGTMKVTVDAEAKVNLLP